MHIATKTGWKDRVSVRDFFDGWREQKPDDRLLFVEDCIGYMYLDFVEHCEGARLSVFPRWLFSVFPAGFTAPPPAPLRLGACRPKPCPPAPARATSCSEPLGMARSMQGFRDDAARLAGELLSDCCVQGVSGAPRSLAHLHRFGQWQPESRQVVHRAYSGPSRPDSRTRQPTEREAQGQRVCCRPIESQRTKEVLRVHVSSCCLILATAETAAVAARVLSSRTRELGSDSWRERLRLRPGRLFSVFTVVCPLSSAPINLGISDTMLLG